MTTSGIIGSYHWAQASTDILRIGEVVWALRSYLAGLIGLNTSWDSGRLQELAPVPQGWRIERGHVVSPPVTNALASSWPFSTCQDGRYDEWYFFRVLPVDLELQAFCNWQGTSLAECARLAYPGGFDLAAQLEEAKPEVVIGDGSYVYVIARQPAVLRELELLAREA